MKILIVDDEKLLVKGMRFNLEQDGYQCIPGTPGIFLQSSASNRSSTGLPSAAVMIFVT